MSIATPTVHKPGSLVRYEARDGVAVLTLTNPPANGYSHEMMLDLDAAVLRARFDDAVHVLVIRGDGDKFFCAGADIGRLAEMAPGYKYNFCLHANETLLRLENTPKLVIAAIGGHCMGGGLEIAMACDLRYARTQAPLKIGLPEVALGVLAGTGGTQRLARLVGRARAIELQVTGKALTVDEAHALGLVTEVLPAEGFHERVLEVARGFVPPARAAKAVGLIKRAVVAGSEVPLESGLALERELQQQLFQSSDAKEGLAAFLEKRKPAFTGR